MTDDPRCGYTVLDADGIEQPCDRPATGWRWYQDVEHEDCLEPACDQHANEGGRRMAEQSEALVRVRALAYNWLRLAGEAMDQDVREWTNAAGRSVFAALDGETP